MKKRLFIQPEQHPLRNQENNVFLKQLPLKKTLIFFFLDFLREIATAVFRRKHIK